MKKQIVFALILAIGGSVALVQGQNAINGGGAAAKMAPGGIGSTVADFKLKDANGKSQTLSSVKGSKGTVLIWVSAQCPMVRAYNERIVQLAADFQSQGINVVGINSNSTESADEIKAHASAVHYSFPVLIDKGNKIADMLGAERTPETILLDANNVIVYRGRIDNSASPAMVKTSELRDAVGDVLAGRAVAKPETTAVGCTIKKAA
ncbi:MAG: thioredoxin family protein [Pyrinomonadaceae bacterium]